MKKRIVAIVMVCLMSVGLVACGGSNDQTTEKEGPSESASSKDNNFAIIATEDFIDNFTENASGFVEPRFVKDYSEEDYNIHEYQVDENAMTAGCIIDIAYDSNDNIRQILLQSRPTDAFTYSYATWSILSVSPDADYETILSELNIMEDGSQKDGTYNSSQDWGNLIFIQTGTICTLSIVLE